MSFVETIKKQDFFKKLAEKKEKNTLSNSILFVCEDEETNRKVLTMTALLLEYKTFDLFDENSAEFFKVENGVDLDIKTYPKNNEKLLVADSNEIVSEAFIKPVNLPYKIFVINGIDVSTEEAQNKLLKILEEPPKNVFFLISAKNETRVLPTIRSRCEKIKIAPLSQEEIESLCQNQLACILGKGYIGKTLALSKDENLKTVVDFAVDLFARMKSSRDVLKFSKRFCDLKDEFDLIVEVFSLCVEDIIKIKCESETLCKLKPYLNDLKDVEPEFSVESLCEISKLVLALQEKLEFNASFAVSIDNFLMRMLEVKYLCK